VVTAAVWRLAPVFQTIQVAMLTADVVHPYRISDQSAERIVLTSQPQWSSAILVSVCSLTLGVLLSWEHLTLLSLIAVIPIVLFRVIYSFIPAAILVEPNHLRIHYRGFLPRIKSESFCAADISAFDGTSYTFRGHYAAVRLIRSNGMSKKIFSGARGSDDLAQAHSRLVATEFASIVGCNHTGS
jgi:hypothetical protein